MGCASAPDAAEMTDTETVRAKVADRAGAELTPAGDSKDGADAVSTGDGSTDRGRMHPCTFSEAAIASEHCIEHHSPGNAPMNGFPLPCNITGCMSNGSTVYYSWEP